MDYTLCFPTLLLCQAFDAYSKSISIGLPLPNFTRFGRPRFIIEVSDIDIKTPSVSSSCVYHIN